MIVFAQPLWFAALAVIPIIYWLHRWHMPEFVIPVSAIFLWEDGNDAPASGPEKKRPDISWWRRALIAALIVLALAQPFWRAQQLSLTVWTDDSLSMRSVEDGASRNATARQILDTDLASSGIDRSAVTLRSLTSPGTAFLPANTSQRSLHWLLTDGSSDAVRGWAMSASISHVIQTGVATENVAISKLSASRSLAADGSFDVLVGVSNTGLAADTRQVELLVEGDRVAETELSLPAGETVYWRTRAAQTTSEITASLQSIDVLADDDTLSIETVRLKPIDTTVDASCGRALRLALAQHPSLEIDAAETTAQLSVTCHADSLPAHVESGGARIRVLRSPDPSETVSPVWAADAAFPQQLLLAADYVKAVPSARSIANDASEVLAWSGDLPLVVGHAISADSSRTIDTVLDLAEPMFTAQPDYPALIAVLVDLAHGRRLLDESVTTSRDARMSVIVPVQLDLSTAPRPSALNEVDSPLSRLVLAMAALILLFDLALIIRGRGGIHRE